MVAAAGPLALDAQGNLTIAAADGVHPGALGAADYQAFGAKLDGLSPGPGLDLAGTARMPLLSVHFGAGGAVADADPRLSDARAPTAGSSLYLQSSPAAPQAASLSISGTLSGEGSGLWNVGSARVGAAGQTLAQALAAATAGAGNATSIKGVAVDDALKSDGFVLAFSAASGQLEYRSQVLGAAPPPAVPASVSWTAASTGNAQCARVKGACTAAGDASGAFSCGTSAASAHATCAGSASINQAATWASANSGEAACTAQLAKCIQAYDGAGLALGCNASSAAGSAACLVTTAAQGWDLRASWTGTPSESGDLACTAAGGNCVATYDGAGNPVPCSSSLAAAASARCLTPAAGSSWSFPATWVNTDGSGNERCTELGGACVSISHSNGNQYPCAQNLGGAGTVVTARCRAPRAADAWDQTTAWSGVDSTGNLECTRKNAQCVAVHHQNGNSYPCAQNLGGAGSAVAATCKSVPAGGAWSAFAAWTGRNGWGNLECLAQQNGACVDVYHQNGNTYPCTQSLGGAGIAVIATCKPAQIGDPWNSHASWTQTASSGDAACAGLGGSCVQAFNRGDGTTRACSALHGAADGGLAMCKK